MTRQEAEKKAVEELRSGTVRLTDDQVDFIKNEFNDKFHDAISDKIDTELIYDQDITEWLNEFTTILDVLNGKYTMDDLYSDMFDYFYNDDDFILEFINDYLYYDDLVQVVNVEVDDVEILPDELLSEC